MLLSDIQKIVLTVCNLKVYHVAHLNLHQFIYMTQASQTVLFSCMVCVVCFFTVVDLDWLSPRITGGGTSVADFEDGTDACSDQQSTGAQRVWSAPRSKDACSCRSGQT